METTVFRLHKPYYQIVLWQVFFKLALSVLNVWLFLQFLIRD